MAKKKPASQSNTRKPRKRKGYNVNVWLTPALGKAIELFMAAQKFKPDKTVVAEAAFQRYLESEGYWPPPEAE